MNKSERVNHRVSLQKCGSTNLEPFRHDSTELSTSDINWILSQLHERCVIIL